MFLFRETFKKSERLCSKKTFDELFEKGNSFFCHPFQVIWIFVSPGLKSPAQVAISVSKRSFRKAVSRNLIKRRIREAYRREKHLLYEYLNKAGIKIAFIIIYKGDRIPDFNEIRPAVSQMIRKLVSSVGETDKNSSES